MSLRQLTLAVIVGLLLAALLLWLTLGWLLDAITLPVGQRRLSAIIGGEKLQPKARPPP